jgi:hypothetical protein
VFGRISWLRRGRMAIALALAAVALVLPELGLNSVGDWWASHPMASAFVSNGILLAAGYLVFDEIVRLREQAGVERARRRDAVDLAFALALGVRAEIGRAAGGVALTIGDEPHPHRLESALRGLVPENRRACRRSGAGDVDPTQRPPSRHGQAAAVFDGLVELLHGAAALRDGLGARQASRRAERYAETCDALQTWRSVFYEANNDWKLAPIIRNGLDPTKILRERAFLDALEGHSGRTHRHRAG